VEAAYVQGSLPESEFVWCIIPEELQTEQMRELARSSKIEAPYWRMKRPLYGLAVAGRLWMETLSATMSSLGYEAVDSANQLWRKWCPVNKDYDVVVAYVDDIIVSAADVPGFWREFKKHFTVSEPEELKRVLGVDISYRRPEKNILEVSTSMVPYTIEVIKRYTQVPGAPPLKPTLSPLVTMDNQTMSKLMNEKGIFESTAASIAMSALYLARMTRPDILAAVTRISTEFCKWSAYSDRLLTRLISYLKETQDAVLTGRIERGADLHFQAFADADLGTPDCPRSTSGGALFVGDGKKSMFLISWHSKRQCATSSSTAEAEIVSLSRFCRDLLLPSEIMTDAIEGIEYRANVFEDNTSAIQIVKSGSSSALLFIKKHHRISISVLADVFSHQHRSLFHVSTDAQRADVFTKVLDINKMKEARAQLGILIGNESLSKDFCVVPISATSSALLATIQEWKQSFEG
jgi:hypothetical protein